MKIQFELDDITRAEQPLRELEAVLEAELAAAESQRPTPTTHNRPHELRTTLRQLRQGMFANEGTDPRVWAALHSEEMQAFRFRSPGLAPLERLRAKLLAEQEAAANPPVPPPVFQFRYTGEPWKKVAGARRQTGDLIQLTQEAASRWASVLEPVNETSLKVTSESLTAQDELRIAQDELLAAENDLRAAKGEPPAA